MNFYTTNGTPDFMERLIEKYPNEQLLLVHGESGKSAVFHETMGKTVFASPHKYTVKDAHGQLEQRGYFVLYHLTVEGSSREIFFNHFSNVRDALQSEDLLLAFRLLEPKRSSEQIVFLTQWVGPALYEAWIQSNSYTENFSKLLNVQTSSVQKIFEVDSYISKYIAAKAE